MSEQTQIGESHSLSLSLSKFHGFCSFVSVEKAPYGIGIYI
jgi:hypothetical protein